MAEIIKFPTPKEIDRRGAIAELAKELAKRGFPSEEAHKVSAEVLDDGNEFVRRLGSVDFAFTTTTADEVRLLKDAAKRFALEVELQWLKQRIEIELRRANLLRL